MDRGSSWKLVILDSGNIQHTLTIPNPKVRQYVPVLVCSKCALHVYYIIIMTICVTLEFISSRIKESDSWKDLYSLGADNTSSQGSQS